MILLFKKSGNTGEIRVIITELDRAERLVDGVQWISLNHAINEFNRDPKIKNISLTASYAGNVPNDTLATYCNMWAAQPKNKLTDKNQNNSEKQKVDTDGNPIEDSNDESEENVDLLSKLHAILDDVDLKCPECGDENSCLIDKEGNKYPCKSCIQIDAYQKGKKEGFDLGYDKGYQDCMKNFQKIIDNIDSVKKENDNGNKNSTISE